MELFIGFFKKSTLGTYSMIFCIIIPVSVDWVLCLELIYNALDFLFDVECHDILILCFVEGGIIIP